ncbi:MAG: type II toxin-antitoxin system MqsA family antitoxin [Spirochaetes bacterium]|nr:type II toxin-antitoxin system MqsA family antitoxin [Spirochaetota bacterium]
MREKKWTDCPACGSKGSMERRRNVTETYRNPGYEPISIAHLDGHFCKTCGEGIYSIKSERTINSTLAREKARQDSRRVVAADLVDVDDVAKILSVSRQRIHQMMDEGKIRYVFVGNKRYPVRQDNASFRNLKKRIHHGAVK